VRDSKYVVMYLFYTCCLQLMCTSAVVVSALYCHFEVLASTRVKFMWKIPSQWHARLTQLRWVDWVFLGQRWVAEGMTGHHPVNAGPWCLLLQRALSPWMHLYLFTFYLRVTW